MLSSAELTAQEYKTWVAQYLDDVVDRIARVSDAAVSFVVIDGQPSKCLVEYAMRSRADLMVMSTHGRGALIRAWLGSVADHVLKGVAIPILLVRPDESGSTDLTKGIKFNHVVAAVDGSELRVVLRLLDQRGTAARAAGTSRRPHRTGSASPAPLKSARRAPHGPLETPLWMLYPHARISGVGFNDQ